MAKTARRAPRRNVAAELVEDYFAALDSGRDSYKKADELLDELMEKVGVGQTVRLDDGREYVIEDQFEKTNKVWKPCGVSRFALAKKR